MGVSAIRQLCTLLQTPAERSMSEDWRSRERHRRVLYAAAAGLAAKVLGVGAATITIPLTLNYLGPERFGVWATISSVTVMLSFADLGIGNGLLTAVARCSGEDDRQGMRAYVSSSTFILIAMSLGLALLFAAAYHWIDWVKVFNLSSPHHAAEAGAASAVFFACLVLNIPLSVVQRVQWGLQRGFIANLFQCGGSIVSVAALLVAIHGRLTLPWLVAALSGGPVLVNAINSVTFFGAMRPDLWPRSNFFHGSFAREIVRSGILFTILQLVVAVAYASDYMVITQIAGPEAVSKYAVPERLFNLIITLLGMVLIPLWPAYGEALARGESMWVKRTLFRSLTAASIFAFTIGSVLVLAGEQIIRIWIGHHLAVPASLLIGLAVWKVLEANGNALAAFLNGAQILQPQVYMALVTAAVALSLKIYLVRHYGYTAIVWGSAVAWSICTLLPLIVILPRILKAISARDVGTVTR
jgi:O-antigen/teichoic acid export membrane protein